jgi:N-acetylmuramoyl-L-alanine amidase
MNEPAGHPVISECLLTYNDRLETRNTSELNLIVLHCTELPTLEMAREYGERITLPDSQTGFSGHYYIDRDGSIHRYVSDDRVARHVIGYNQNSLGLEIVNLGRYPNWFHSAHQECTDPYPRAQIEGVKHLLRVLKRTFPQIRDLARHSDLDATLIPAEDDPRVQIRRKIDPGPLFPWEEVLEEWERMCKTFGTQ